MEDKDVANARGLGTTGRPVGQRGVGSIAHLPTTVGLWRRRGDRLIGGRAGGSLDRRRAARTAAGGTERGVMTPLGHQKGTRDRRP